MKVDLHTHTVASGHAWGTLFENVKEAKSKGIKLLAITDHGPSALGASTDVYFKSLKRIPKTIDGVRILSGVEANIINNKGKLDLEDEVLKKLDVVIVGFHKRCGYTDQGIKKNTKVLIKAMQNPYVKMLSHPYQSKIKIDIEKITQEAIKRNILLEINASYFFTKKIADKEIMDKLKLMIKILKENKKKMIINSDAHNPYEIGNFDDVISRFDELGINEDNLLNNDKEAVFKFFNIS
ncbi:PHP domain-containing protein [bacterium]|nr:PHP domain-containing protein [bacterium]